MTVKNYKKMQNYNASDSFMKKIQNDVNIIDSLYKFYFWIDKCDSSTPSFSKG